MIEFLLTGKVRKVARDYLSLMKEKNSYAPLSPDSKKYPLSHLRETQVFGVLLFRTPSGEDGKLFSYSGSINGSYEIPGYVPPCFSLNEFKKTVDINDKRIHELTSLIENGDTALKEERARLSNETLERLHQIYTFYTWEGKKIHGLPPSCPTGTGECAGLKLINWALKKGYEIKGLAEFRLSGEFYTPCKERCALLLPRMLGLDILYADEDIALINKPSGLLSVPGRGEDKIDSVSYRFHKLFPSSPKECFVHRLDMDTSGLIIMAFNEKAKKNLNLQFENRTVKKTYIALLEGKLSDDKGIIDLPHRLDVDNRPYQVVDYINGKKAITYWEKLGLIYIDKKPYTKVHFFPLTGRTHQLRVHAAFALMHPIKGDRLYGKNEDGERLYLHAESICFIHPGTNLPMVFCVSSPF